MDLPIGLPADELDRLCLQNLLDSDPEAVYFKDLEGRYLRLSRSHAYALGYDDVAGVIGKTAFDLLPADEAKRMTDDERSIMRTRVPVVELQERVVRPGQEDSWVVTTRQPLLDDDGQVIGTFGVTRDITVRKLMEQRVQDHADQVARANAELLRVEAELRAILDASPDITVRYDTELRIRYANPVARATLGLGTPETIGLTHEEIGRHGSEAIEGAEHALLRVLSHGGTEEHEYELPQEDGSVRYLHTRLVPERDSSGEITGVLSISRDLTDRKRAEDLLADQAVRDPLTGLANRVLLADRLERAILRLDREPGVLAVLTMDLDRFKVINDSLGHGAGDALIVEIADRLRNVARRIDTVARFGGDEFVILAERLAESDDAARIADRILGEVTAPFTWQGNEIHPSASIGIATTTTSNTTAEILIRDADAAMHQAKDGGRARGTYQFFDATVRARAVARLAVESQLRQALADKEFRLLYQPVQNLQDGSLVGVEALIRWQRADGSIVSPADFIPVAEDSGLIVPIGQWVLNEALRQLALWNARRPADQPLTMAVNLSARQLQQADLVDEVARALRRHAVPANLLCLEITETALLEEALVTAETFRRLPELGVRLALDDFGTGYSSLGHLRRYPVNILKIDRTFVDGLGRASDLGPIVAAVTAMARALGMRTVGEGIETAEQLDELRRLDCDEGQGYLFARPLPAAEIEQRFLQWSDESGAAAVAAGGSAGAVEASPAVPAAGPGTFVVLRGDGS